MTNKTNKTEKFAWIQICWLIVSVFLFAGAVFAEVHSDDNLIIIAKTLGGVMLFAGLVNLLISDIKHDVICGSKWLMAEGLTATLLSIFPLFNKMSWPIMIPFFFGMWEFFSGILKLMDSAELKDDKIGCWKVFAIIGWVELMSGTASLIKPFDDVVGMSNVIAGIFLIQGCGFLLKAVMYKQLIKKQI